MSKHAKTKDQIKKKNKKTFNNNSRSSIIANIYAHAYFSHASENGHNRLLAGARLRRVSLGPCKRGRGISRCNSPIQWIILLSRLQHSHIILFDDINSKIIWDIEKHALNSKSSSKSIEPLIKWLRSR